jgi:hypothetical protein
LQQSALAHVAARRRAEQDHDYAGAIALLEEVPLQLRDASLYVALCQRRDRVEQLDRHIRIAVQNGHFARLRSPVTELLHLTPERDDMRRLLAVLPVDTPLERQMARNTWAEMLALAPQADEVYVVRRDESRAR